MKKTKRFLALVLCSCIMLGFPALSNIFDSVAEFITTVNAAEGNFDIASAYQINSADSNTVK